MSFRFRKSLKIAPGIRLNVGTKSVGISAGVRGARVSTNTRTGTRVTLSAPGTGLSYSAKVGGKANATPTTAAPQPVPSPAPTAPSIQVFADEIDGDFNDGTGYIRIESPPEPAQTIDFVASTNGRFWALMQQSEVCVMEVEGEEMKRELFRYAVGGNILDAGVSDDASLLVLQIQEGDEEGLALIDTNADNVLWSIEPRTGSHLKRYRFDEAAGLLYLRYDDGGQFPYRLSDGAFTGEKAFRQHCL